MIGLIQRVTEASVTIEQQQTARIGPGILALIGIEQTDDSSTAEALLEKLLTYRIFEDAAGKMNLGLEQVQGELLLVPQFTLVADTGRGLRPGFSRGAPPSVARPLFENLLDLARQRYQVVEAGSFGADMKVHLVNDGPVTFWLQT